MIKKWMIKVNDKFISILFAIITYLGLLYKNYMNYVLYIFLFVIIWIIIYLFYSYLPFIVLMCYIFVVVLLSALGICLFVLFFVRFLSVAPTCESKAACKLRFWTKYSKTRSYSAGVGCIQRRIKNAIRRWV